MILCLSIHIHSTNDHKDKKEFLKTLWAKRGIYGQIIVHLYDTATDVGVLVEWYRLAYDTVDYESIDMVLMFWISLCLQLFYRVALSLIAAIATWNVNYKWEMAAFTDCCLGFWDLYIIKTVYRSLKCDEDEPNAKQKAIQLLEAILEALPQVCIQCKVSPPLAVLSPLSVLHRV